MHVPTNGGAKKRRVASDIIPHDIENADHRGWLSWRLVAVEHDHEVQTIVNEDAVLLRARRPTMDDVALENVRSVVEAAIIEAQSLTKVAVQMKADVVPKVADLEAATRPLVDQYGLIFKSPKESTDPFIIVGPPEPSRDAAALLASRFVQGKSTAVVLQVPGQVQAMPDQMKSDMGNDMKELMAELKVEVKQHDTMVWIDGLDAESVSSAKETLQEMLQFYLEEQFSQCSGLKPAMVDRLQKDPGLRALMARPGFAIAFDREEGTAWVCGKSQEPIQQRIDAVIMGKVPAIVELRDDENEDEELDASPVHPAAVPKSAVAFQFPPAQEEEWQEQPQLALQPKAAPMSRGMSSDHMFSGDFGMPYVEKLRPPKPWELPGMLQMAGLSEKEALEVSPQRRFHVDDYDDVSKQFEPDLLWPPGDMRELSWDVLSQFWSGMEEQFAPQHDQEFQNEWASVF